MLVGFQHGRSAALRLLTLALLTSLLLSVALLPGAPAQAYSPISSPGAQNTSQPSVPAIEGWVTDGLSGTPLGDAAVEVASDYGTVTTSSDATGYFSLAPVALGGPSTAPLKVRVTARHAGFQGWHARPATYYPGDTLRIYAHLYDCGLRTADCEMGGPRQGGNPQVPGLRSMQAIHNPSSAIRNPQLSQVQPPGQNVPPLAPPIAPVPAPATIRVYRTATGTVDVVPFRDYLKHVLPNEWIPTWRPDALKAGAMAVKTYAIYWVAQQKQAALGADLRDDTEDQVYDPDVSYASTDAAVDATFDYAMTRGGLLFSAQYCAGTYDPDPTGDCPWPGVPYMTQWGSAYYADLGKSWAWILGFYYGVKIAPDPAVPAYDGTSPGPPPTPVTSAEPTAQPAVPAGFSVGQGGPRPDLFKDAYNRNGGSQVLGTPIAPVHWWLQYVSEFNLYAQQLSGPQGKGDVWIVYDPFKPGGGSGDRAFIMAGQIAAAFAPGAHQPPGPEWLGAPVADPFISSPSVGSLPAQSFENGVLTIAGGSVQFTPWISRFSGWKTEFFIGHPAVSGPQIPGQPVMVQDWRAPGFDWPESLHAPQSLGVGNGDWSVQYTRDLQLDGGTYDFLLSANSSMRVWIDNTLAVNGSGWKAGQLNVFSADIAPGTHTIRVQYFGDNGQAQLDFSMHSRHVTPEPRTDINTQGKRKPARG